MSDDGKMNAGNGFTVPAQPSDIDRAVFLGTMMADNLYTAFMILAAELWSVRRRQKIVEALLAERGAVTLQAIETYRPSAEQEAEWHRDRDQFIAAVYDPFQRKEGVAYHDSLHFEPRA